MTRRPDWDSLAAAAGCSRRTLERYRRAGGPVPVAGEAVAAWVDRLRSWLRSRPRRTGRVLAEEPEPAAAPAPGVDWEEQSRRALALTRMHDLAVKRGEFVARKQVVEEWARRCWTFRTRALALPRIIAARCANSPADVVEREAAGIVREMLAEFARRAELAPTPADFDAPAAAPEVTP